MKVNEKMLNFIDILKDLDDIGKKLYLESPEAWIDFSDKVGDKIVDEMILFYVAKFNYVSILKYVVDNNVIDLDSPSKNKSYPSIREHLLAVSKSYKSLDVYNFLNNDYKSSENKTEKTTDKSVNQKETVKEKDNTNDYFPVCLCPHCNANILKSGYKIYEEVNFAFSQDKGRADELSRKKDNRIFCSTCNNNINNLTLEFLEDICSIHNCKNCGKDLTKIGINEKVLLNFNGEGSKFVSNKKTYNCPSCDKQLNDTQIKYFNL